MALLLSARCVPGKDLDVIRSHGRTVTYGNNDAFLDDIDLGEGVIHDGFDKVSELSQFHFILVVAQLEENVHPRQINPIPNGVRHARGQTSDIVRG